MMSSDRKLKAETKVCQAEGKGISTRIFWLEDTICAKLRKTFRLCVTLAGRRTSRVSTA